MYAPTGDQNDWDRGGGSRQRVYAYKKEPVVSSITSILRETNSQEGGIGLYTHSLQFIPPTPRQTLRSPEVSPLPTEVPWNSLFAGSSREFSRNPQYTPLPTGSPLEILPTPLSALKLLPPPHPPSKTSPCRPRSARTAHSWSRQSHRKPSPQLWGPKWSQGLGGRVLGTVFLDPDSFCLFKSSPAKPNSLRLHRPTPASGLEKLGANPGRRWPECQSVCIVSLIRLPAPPLGSLLAET